MILKSITCVIGRAGFCPFGDIESLLGIRGKDLILPLDVVMSSCRGSPEKKKI